MVRAEGGLRRGVGRVEGGLGPEAWRPRATFYCWAGGNSGHRSSRGHTNLSCHLYYSRPSPCRSALPHRQSWAERAHELSRCRYRSRGEGLRGVGTRPPSSLGLPSPRSRSPVVGQGRTGGEGRRDRRPVSRALNRVRTPLVSPTV